MVVSKLANQARQTSCEGGNFKLKQLRHAQGESFLPAYLVASRVLRALGRTGSSNAEARKISFPAGVYGACDPGSAVFPGKSEVD